MLHIKKFDTLQSADGYIITEPFVTGVADSELLYCNEPDKKLKKVENKVIVVGIGPKNDEIWYTSSDQTIITPNVTTVSVIDNQYNTTKNKGIVKFSGTLEHLDREAFSSKTKLTSAILPDSTMDIAYCSFKYCTNLASIDLGEGVTNIGEYAFRDCSSLTSIEIPNSVTSIRDFAFYCCNSLTSVTIPNSVTSIGDGAFRNCSGLTSLSVEAGNTVYDSHNNCNAIIETSTNTLIFGCQNTTIPDSVTSIGKSAFAGCRGLTSVTIPNSVTSIGYYAFRDCSGLTSVTIGNSVTSIGKWAFGGCSGLISVTIPNSVTSIENWVFDGCRGLTSITIPDSVTSIGDGAFNNCSGLTYIRCLAETTPTIGSGCFDNTNNCPIYVLDHLVGAYKNAWPAYASRITGTSSN